jgi:hypothetical protein
MRNLAYLKSIMSGMPGTDMLAKGIIKFVKHYLESPLVTKKQEKM